MLTRRGSWLRYSLKMSRHSGLQSVRNLQPRIVLTNHFQISCLLHHLIMIQIMRKCVLQSAKNLGVCRVFLVWNWFAPSKKSDDTAVVRAGCWMRRRWDVGFMFDHQLNKQIFGKHWGSSHLNWLNSVYYWIYRIWFVASKKYEHHDTKGEKYGIWFVASKNLNMNIMT